MLTSPQTLLRSPFNWASKVDRKELQLKLSNVQASIKARTADIDKLTTEKTDTEAALIAARSSLEERLGALQLAEGQLAMVQAQNQSAEQKIRALETATAAPG